MSILDRMDECSGHLFNWNWYSKSYLLAGLAIIECLESEDFIRENEAYHFVDIMLNPALQNIRIGIELGLKGCIDYISFLSDKDIATTTKILKNKGHQIIELAKELEKTTSEAVSKYRTFVDGEPVPFSGRFNEIIMFFHSLDPSGFDTRYPVDGIGYPVIYEETVKKERYKDHSDLKNDIKHLISEFQRYRIQFGYLEQYSDNCKSLIDHRLWRS